MKLIEKIKQRYNAPNYDFIMDGEGIYVGDLIKKIKNGKLTKQSYKINGIDFKHSEIMEQAHGLRLNYVLVSVVIFLAYCLATTAVFICILIGYNFGWNVTEINMLIIIIAGVFIVVEFFAYFMWQSHEINKWDNRSLINQIGRMVYSSYKPSESEIKELVKELVEAVEKAMDADGVEKVSREFVKAIAGKFDKIRSSIDKDGIIARAYRIINQSNWKN